MLLAIDESNARNALVKIDRWRRLVSSPVFHRPFPIGMYIAHDLETLSHPTHRIEPRRYLDLST